MPEMDKAYEAKQWEPRLYQAWEDAGLFKPEGRPGIRRGTWSCTLPPPNATGVLHAGHVVMVAYQDCLARYHRLRGKRVLWVPGTDHAAIATQTTVEKKILSEEGKTRHDLGRAEFLERVHAFVAGSQDTIQQQLRATGASLDWSRQAFTLDAARARAVRVAFKRLFDDQLIYRGLRVVNWCPRCLSTLADDEVVHQEDVAGKLYVIQYGPVQVATTRPETKLGDTGLAVNPSDERYENLVGQTLAIKLASHEVTVKVIADREVDQAFGTGVVGVTPAHSAVDERMAQRHSLPSIQVIGEGGRMTDAAGPYAGMTVGECRQKFLADLDAAGQLVEQRDHSLSLGRCYRCETPVEPMPKEQWFVAVDAAPKSGGQSFKQRLLEAVDGKNIAITPERFEASYRRWAENLRDWCISRQIWYGHRIPAYHYSDGATVVTDQLPVEVLWTRHGPTDLTEQSVIQGYTKEPGHPLSAQGRQQAEELGASLRGQDIDVIICSPLLRARETAAIVAAALNVGVAVEPLLTEQDYGVAEGRPIAEVEREYPEYVDHRRTFEFPKGETVTRAEERSRLLFAALLKRYAGKRILCISHGRFLRTVLHQLNGRPMETIAERVPPAGTFSDEYRTSLIGPSPKTGTWRCDQDPDTLDTWFSSSLWTFSTLGWPDKTTDLKNFHPTDWMETGYDILNAWVSKMVMMSHYLLGQWPFKNVYLHGLVRDEQGRKMSKSLGNGINPLDVIPRYGADALRLALIANTAPGNDMRLSEEKIAGYRNFANKLWNIGRFVLHVTPDAKPSQKLPKIKTPAEQWIVARLHQTLADVTTDLETFQFSHAIESLHRFTWDELADWYLEVAKLQPNPKLLAYILTQTLVAWHPLCPFVTEAIWQHFAKPRGKKDLLMAQRWPGVESRKQKIENRKFEFGMVIDLVTQIRTQRAAAKVEAGQTINVAVSTDKSIAKLLAEYKPFVERATKCSLEIDAAGTASLKISYALPVNEAQVAREREQLQGYIASLQTKLGDQFFVAKAPPAVVDEQRRKLAEAQRKLEQM